MLAERTRITVPGVAATACPVLTAAAQTVGVAGRADLALAETLCVLHDSDVAGAGAIFIAAGFDRSSRAAPGIRSWHEFTAPAVTLTPGRDEGQMSPHREVVTNVLVPADVTPAVAGLLGKVAPGRFWATGPGPKSSKTHLDGGAIPLVVTVATVGNLSRCPAIGSASVLIMSAV